MTMNLDNIWLWIGFSLFIILALSFDTFLSDKNIIKPSQSIRAAIYWSLFWICLSLLFNAVLWICVYSKYGMALANKKGLDFLTGYLIEKTLAFDNLFAFYIIFKQFKIPVQYQQRVFSYGIWSAIILRLIFILVGVWLIEQFHWVLYLMGAFLLFTGIKMFFAHEKEKDFTDTVVLRTLRRFLRITRELHEEHFFIRLNHLIYVTPLFIALVFIEISDVIFALDSIPAIFAITTDPFIVWSSNIFAILGLRALYFLLAGLANEFRLIKYGVALILVFVGCKMLVERWVHISGVVSLIIVAVILFIFTLLSILERKKMHRRK